MSFYVDLINETIDYIENNIKERLTLRDVSEQFNVSHFHFNRMFKTVTGTTLKQYILGRKLAYALEKLKNTKESVIDIALEIGFEYPEVFSRAFKKQFGISPALCRSEENMISGIKKACVVERDIINYQGKLTLKGDYIFLKELHLRGEYIDVDVNTDEFETSIKVSSQGFLSNSQGIGCLKHDRFFTVINCHEKDDGKYTVFSGKQILEGESESIFRSRIVPKGWYARFIYHGDMFDIKEIFTDDLYRWVIVKEIELNPNGVGMLNVFKEDYAVTRCVEIFVPIKSSKMKAINVMKSCR